MRVKQGKNMERSLPQIRKSQLSPLKLFVGQESIGQLGICSKFAHWVLPVHSPQGFILQVLRLCTGFVIFVPRYPNYSIIMWFHLVWFCLLWYDLLISMSETFWNHSSCNRQTRGTVDRDWATVAKAAQDTPASIQTSSWKHALIYWY